MIAQEEVLHISLSRGPVGSTSSALTSLDSIEAWKRNTSLPKRYVSNEMKRTSLRESLTRYRNELLPVEERMHLQDLINRLRRQLRLA